MMDRCGRMLLADVLQILFNDGGFVQLSFLCIDVNHMVLHQSEEFRVPQISDLFSGINTVFFP